MLSGEWTRWTDGRDGLMGEIRGTILDRVENLGILRAGNIKGWENSTEPPKEDVYVYGTRKWEHRLA
jgi:hypothetical protein